MCGADVEGVETRARAEVERKRLFRMLRTGDCVAEREMGRWKWGKGK